jgi:hypothetical protein
VTARLYDLQAHPSRRGRSPKLFIPGPMPDRYARLADETAATLAEVRAAIPDGRSNRALRQRLDALTGAVNAMASVEIAVREIYRAGHAAGMTAALGTRGRDTAPRTRLRVVDSRPGGAA